jgi:hypothetical protein
MSRPGCQASGRRRSLSSNSTEEVGDDDSITSSRPATHLLAEPALRARRDSAVTIDTQLIIAWAWYVDGVRKPPENLSVAAHLANAGEGFVWLGLKDPRMGI